MYVPNIAPISGPSFAQIAAEPGLTQSSSRSRSVRSAAMPAQRSSRHPRVEVATR